MKVYTELDKAIKAKLEEITEFKTVEAYNDQYRNTKTEDAKIYPAVYFELLEPINWEDASNDWQTANIKARIHVVSFDLRRDKNKIHPLAQLVFEKMDKTTLLGTGGYNLTSKWSRSASSLPKRYKQLKVIKIDFNFEAFDSSSMPILGSQTIGFTIP